MGPDSGAIAEQVFTALADPTRRDIVATLAAAGLGTATDLAGRLPVTRKTTVKHLARRGEADLVRPEPGERRRVQYRLRPAPMQVARHFLAATARELGQPGRPPRPGCSPTRPSPAPRKPEDIVADHGCTTTVAAARTAMLAATLGLAAASWGVAAWQMHEMKMGVATRLGSFASFTAVWVVMMAAMMLPGAAPAVLRRAHVTGGMRAVPPFIGSRRSSGTSAAAAARTRALG